MVISMPHLNSTRDSHIYIETDMSGGLISFKDTRITSIRSVSIARHLQQYDCTGFIFCKFC